MSPAAQLSSQFGAIAEQGATAAKMAAIQKALGRPPGYVEQLAVIRPFAVEHDALAKIGTVIPTGIDPKIIEAIRGVQPFTMDPGLASALSRAQQQFEEAVRPLGGVAEAFAKFEQQHHDAQKAMLATLAGPFGDRATK